MADVRYDPAADVLHVFLDDTPLFFGEGLEGWEDVVVTLRAAETKEVVGFRILGAKALIAALEKKEV